MKIGPALVLSVMVVGAAFAQGVSQAPSTGVPNTASWSTGSTGIVLNSGLTSSAQIGAAASSCTAPNFIPQRGAATTGFGGDGSVVCGVVGGASAFTASATVFNAQGTAASTSATTGSLVAGGGLGVSGRISLTGSIAMDQTRMISFQGSNVTPTTANYSLYGDATNTILNVVTGGVLLFRVNNSTVAQMDTNGITVGTIGSDATHTDSTVCQDTTSHLFLSGSGAAGICLGTSSARFKRNIRPDDADYRNVLLLEPKAYQPTTGPERTHHFFIAEDVQKVFPGLVGTDEEGRANNIDYLGLMTKTIALVQEQQRQIADLESQVKRLAR